MISHGFVSAAMFLCVGVMYDRMHSRQIADYGGVVNTMPKFAAFMMLFAMANAGLPATSGFVGEFLVILAAVKVELLARLPRGDDADPRRRLHAVDVQARDLRRRRQRPRRELTDLARREFWLLAIVAVLVCAMGVYPKPFIDVMHTSVADLLAHVARSKL